MNNKLIITLLGSCWFGLKLSAATIDFITPNDNFGTIDPALARKKSDNTPHKFIPPEAIKYFSDPIKHSAPPSHLRLVTAYPLWKSENPVNEYEDDDDDESNAAPSSDQSGVMYMSLMSGSFFNEVGAGIQPENAQQMAGHFSELPVFHVNASQFPLLAEYYQTERNFTLHGTLPDALLEDIEYLLRLAVERYGSLASIDNSAPIRYFLRWARASGAIYTLKRMYHASNADGLNRQRLKACLDNINQVVQFYNLLSNLGIANNDRMFSDFFQAYLLNFVEGDFSIGEMSVSASSQIVSVLFSVIVYNSALLRTVAEQNFLSFDYFLFYDGREEIKKRYPDLQRLLNSYFINLIDDTRKRQRLADAFIYILLKEGVLLQQLENSTLDGSGSASRTSSQPESPHTLLAPRVMEILNTLALQGEETGTSAATAVVALMHMPTLISTFNDLASTQGHNLSAFAAMVTWLRTYFTSLQTGIPTLEEIPLIRAALYSFFQQNSPSPHRESVSSHDPHLERLLTAVIAEWLKKEQQNNEGFETIETEGNPEGFEAMQAVENSEGAYNVFADEIEPAVVASQLFTLYPSLDIRLALHPVLANSGNRQNSRLSQIQKDAVKKVLLEL